MSGPFVPLTIDKMDEGRFLPTLDSEMKLLQQALFAFKQKYGENAKGAKAKLAVEFTLVCEDPKEELFSIKAQIKKSVPALPPIVNVALVAKDEKGRDSLFVRRHGASEGSPRQAKLATDDGRTIDQETGEAVKQEDGRKSE